MNTKYCRKCKTQYDSPESNFFKNKKSDDGLNHCCKKCHIGYGKKYTYKKRQSLNTFTENDWKECLDFFGNRDAYTGELLYDPVKEHVIPISKNGDTIRENIIPCNSEINCSKRNRDMIEWYIEQPYYSEFRLQRILKWMGDYASRLKEPQGVSFENIKNKTSQRFKITLPDGSKFARSIYYFKSSGTQERVQLLDNVVLNGWSDYMREHWFDDQYKKYNSTKQILERCATFLLQGNLRSDNGNILGETAIENIAKYEINLSNAPSEAQQAIGQFEFEKRYSSIDEFDVEENIDTRVDEKPKGKRKNRRFKDTKTAKANSLYSTKELRTYKVKVLKNKDIQYVDEVAQVHNILPPRRYVTDDNGDIDSGKLSKWENSNSKNVYGQSITDVEYVTIGGNKGIIPLNKPYISEWCVVDTKNTFVFNGTAYQISKSVKQYKIQADNKAEMDKILCIFVDGKVHFFDQNVDEIKAKSVKQV